MKLAAVRHQQVRLLGKMEGLGLTLRSESTLQSLTQDVITTSAIEGNILDRDQVRSSLARRLGVDIGALAPEERLTKTRLFGWHAALFPTGFSGISQIRVGRWRNDAKAPMRVVSGPLGRENVHFEAPPAPRVESEMRVFPLWFNAVSDDDLVLKAAVAHLWFLTIHPFDDGNGRIARALTDLLLARSEDSGDRFHSMSAQIRQERRAYYRLLEQTQKGDLDVTPWIVWFLDCFGRAVDRAETTLANVIEKATFWDRHRMAPINERQRRMIDTLVDGTFEGALTTTKWAKITKCSPDTALRDIESLIALDMLTKIAGGRSTRYALRRIAARDKDGSPGDDPLV